MCTNISLFRDRKTHVAQNVPLILICFFLLMKNLAGRGICVVKGHPFLGLAVAHSHHTWQYKPVDKRPLRHIR